MIRKAARTDISAVAQGYEELFHYEAIHGSTTNWVEGLYPTKNTAAGAVRADTLYVLESEDVLCGSMILNQIQPDEYKAVDWKYPAKDHQILVIHTLCIRPSQAKKGYGRQMVAFALKEAERLGCTVVRLDTWEGNHPAASLYKNMGFRLAGSAPVLLQGVIPEQQIFFERKVGNIK